MALTAASVINRVRTQLIDEGTSPRWTDTELLRYLSDAERTIASIDPTSTRTTASVLLAEGSRQALPSGGQKLISIDCNMGTAGATPGKAVRITTRELMDDFDINWQGASKSSVIKNFMFDPMDEESYYVYPPSNALGYVRIIYSILPTELTATTDSLTVGDVYVPALTDFVLYRAHLKDSDFSAGSRQADYYYQAFTRFLLGEDKGAIESNPNLETTEFDARSKGRAR